MSEEAGPGLDPAGEARNVLRGAVADYGDQVLSSPAVIEGICEDRLPDWPREASLISAAAHADVPAMLQQQAAGLGADTAVRLTAATLAQTRSLDPGACVWVVGEFARALGYQVSQGLRPAGPGPPLLPGPAGGAGESATVLPGPGPEHPPTEMAEPGQAETIEAGRAAPAGAAPPPAMPGPGPGGAGRRRHQVIIAAVAVVAAVAVYFIVAGVARMPPFTRGSSPSPSPSPSPNQAPSLTADERTLLGLIPVGVSANGRCSPRHPQQFGSLAEIHCNGAPNSPADFAVYYLYSSSAQLISAYDSFLSEFANVERNTGPCSQVSGKAAFAKFTAPCETTYELNNVPKGRVAEYYYKGVPDITAIFDSRLVLADFGGRDGNALLAWWTKPSDWING